MRQDKVEVGARGAAGTKLRETRFEEQFRVGNDAAHRYLSDIEMTNIRNAIIFTPLGQKVKKDEPFLSRVIGTLLVVYTITEFPDHTLVVLYQITPYEGPTVAERTRALLEAIRLVRQATGL